MEDPNVYYPLDHQALLTVVDRIMQAKANKGIVEVGTASFHYNLQTGQVTQVEEKKEGDVIGLYSAEASKEKEPYVHAAIMLIAKVELLKRLAEHYPEMLSKIKAHHKEWPTKVNFENLDATIDSLCTAPVLPVANSQRLFGNSANDKAYDPNKREMLSKLTTAITCLDQVDKIIPSSRKREQAHLGNDKLR